MQNNKTVITDNGLFNSWLQYSFAHLAPGFLRAQTSDQLLELIGYYGDVYPPDCEYENH